MRDLTAKQAWIIVGAVIAVLIVIFAVKQARASDMPKDVERPSMSVEANAPFTGGYIGIQGGWGQYDARDTSILPTLAPTIYDGKFNGDGWFGGINAGYDHQFGPLVLGIVADYSWADLNGSKSITIAPAFNIGVAHQIERFGTARARGGIAFDNLLVYGTGGVAYAETNATISSPFGSVSSSTDRVGWAYGGGLEWKFLEGWSASVEYIKLDFGSDNVAFNGPGGFAIGVPVDLNADIVKAAVNRRF